MNLEILSFFSADCLFRPIPLSSLALPSKINYHGNDGASLIP